VIAQEVMAVSNKRTARAARNTMELDPAHAPGKRHLALPHDPGLVAPSAPVARLHAQPWVATSGRVGRSRRSGRGG
jgi:hypothetical protein